MEIFSTLFIKIFPLYILIFLGYLAGRKFKIEHKPIASILIYFLTPVVVFGAVSSSTFTIENFSLPLVLLIIGSCVCFLFLGIGKIVWKNENEKNLLALSAGQGNTGYFGLPLILILFGEQYFTIAVLLTIGSILFENTSGYFAISRGRYSTNESLRRIFRLPAFYAFLFGIIFSFFTIKFSPEISSLFISFRGAYIVLGMMMIGLGLSNIKMEDFDWKLISLSFLAKFFIWPIFMFLVIFIDKNFTHLYSDFIYQTMLILSVVPIASNTVAYASLVEVKPEKASIVVFLSTIFSLVYIPLFVAFFI